MTETLAQIYLHGPLAERFGERHTFAVRTPVEAVSALDANYPGFLAAFAKHERYGLFVDGDWRDGDAAASLPFSRELHFCPIIEGRAFVGAALVTAVTGGFITGTAATIIGGVLVAGLMIGLSFLLTPKIPKQEDDQRDENYAFTGPENVTGQGVTVPLIYGRVHAGTVVVSAGLDLGTDLAPAPMAAPAQTPPSSAVEAGLAPPPGGWPPIIDDSQNRPHPQGWRLVTQINAFVTVMNIALVWQHPTIGRYVWSRVRGFYSMRASDWPDKNDWQEASER